MMQDVGLDETVAIIHFNVDVTGLAVERIRICMPGTLLEAMFQVMDSHRHLAKGYAYEDNRDTAELTVINEMAYELPNSGGMGIFPCILSGVVMMMAACGLYFRKRREDGI